MNKFDFARTIAAIACTMVFSSIAVFGAVGPAQAGASVRTAAGAYATTTIAQTA